MFFIITKLHSHATIFQHFLVLLLYKIYFVLDISIIKAAAKGEKKAEKQLFEHFYPYVMSIALRYMHQEAEAEECLNDTFYKFFKSLKKFNSKMDLKPWVRRITVNVCIDALRKRKNGYQTLEIDHNTMDKNIGDELIIPENIAVLPLIQQLPDAYRTVFNLYVFEDYKHREIAQILGISEGTSKSNYARAKTLIRKMIANNPNELKRILFHENRM
jgi:RNA polymerase sigma factor (sigma-70 family)